MAVAPGASSPGSKSPLRAKSGTGWPGAARGAAGDLIFRCICQAGALSILIVAALLLIVLVWKSWLAIETIGGKFFTSTTWDPEPSHRQFGALAFVYGTVVTSFIAMLIAVPLGIGTATFLSEIATGWVRRVGAFLVEMLAAIPSVVYGFWGLFVLAPFMQRVITALGGPNNGGVGILSAGIILSIMILPYVAAVSYDVCRAVPRSQREGALALGATRWQTIRSVVLPYARPGIVGGCFIALGRALGETMAVTMLIGNRPEVSFSPFAMADSIASVIANQFTEATYDLYLSALVELGLVLLVVSVAVNSIARLLILRMTAPRKSPNLLARLLGSFLSIQKRPATAMAAAAAERDGAATPVPRLPNNSRSANVVNRLMTFVLGFCLLVSTAPLFLILTHLIARGLDSLSWNFFVKLPVAVGESGGGMAHAIYGSLMLVGLATLFAVPVGLLAAIFLVEYRSERLGPAVRFIGELLGGVPSIVVGIFAYNLIVAPTKGYFGWAGAFALGVMMIPVVMRASEEAIKLVPRSIRDASFALGASHYQTVLRVSVPAAFPAIITAIFLAIARVSGETAPLLLTAFDNQFWPTSPSDFTPSLPVTIWSYAMSAREDWHRQAWAAALMLLVFIMLLNVGIRLVTGKRVLLAGRAD